jgi:hypothetical protein|tara:strand:+ start:470 stop:844 length:375 start_codon:yes stop_codon:yes gene_type:complete
MQSYARRVNEWVFDHKEEVARRLAICGQVSDKPAILRRVDGIPEKEDTLVARVSDIDTDNIHRYGNKSRGIYLALNPTSYSELNEPSRVIVEAYRMLSISLLVSPYPKEGTQPLALHVGPIYFD